MNPTRAIPSRSHAPSSRLLLLAAALALVPALAHLAAPRAHAQRVVSQAERVITVARGASALLINGVRIARVNLGDPNIADATVVSPTEVVINGRALGTTTLLVWDEAGQVRVFSVEVTADAPALERYLRTLLPGEEIDVAASGNTVTLSGEVKDPLAVARAIEAARTTGATVFDNMVAPPAQQVLLKVRFAEINRSLLKEWSTRLTTVNPQDIHGRGNYAGSSRSDGQIQFFLEEGADCAGPTLTGGGSCIDALINAAKSRGDFRSLAEPNLMTLPGREAYFLAGGEFPFPTIQAGANNQALTIVFKEFGIRLRYTPTVLRNGGIRLKLAPEVSSLDFANGLVVNGFQIPTILSRRAETEVELKPGQYLAIAGLLDNNMLKNVTKIPILGDLPIIGELFKSRENRQGRRELLVLISPELVLARAQPAPLPTGEPASWGLDKNLTRPAVPRDTAAARADPTR